MELPTLRQKTDTETGSRPDSLIDIGAIQVLYLLTYLLTYLLYPAIFQGDFATNSTDDLYANQQTPLETWMFIFCKQQLRYRPDNGERRLHKRTRPDFPEIHSRDAQRANFHESNLSKFNYASWTRYVTNYWELLFIENCNLISSGQRLKQCGKYYCPTIRRLSEIPEMANNSGRS